MANCKYIGLKNRNNAGLEMEIIEYFNDKNITVRFEDGTVVKNKQLGNFKAGEIRNPNMPNTVIVLNKKQQLGRKAKNNQGLEFEIVDYKSCNKVTARFEDGTEVITSVGSINSGSVRNPNSPTVFGVGIAGNTCPITVEGKVCPEYSRWQFMLRKCYDEKYIEKRQKGIACKVVPEWLEYATFYEWVHSQSNIDEFLANPGEYELSKSFFDNSNLLYSPENCILVPHDINTLLLSHESRRGKLPIGVQKQNNKFFAQCNGKNGPTNLGFYDTAEEAFTVYKTFKEERIKCVATEAYNVGKITKNCYDKLMKYEVNITD